MQRLRFRSVPILRTAWRICAETMDGQDLRSFQETFLSTGISSYLIKYLRLLDCALLGKTPKTNYQVYQSSSAHSQGAAIIIAINAKTAHAQSTSKVTFSYLAALALLHNFKINRYYKSTCSLNVRVLRTIVSSIHFLLLHFLHFLRLSHLSVLSFSSIVPSVSKTVRLHPKDKPNPRRMFRRFAGSILLPRQTHRRNVSEEADRRARRAEVLSMITYTHFTV